MSPSPSAHRFRFADLGLRTKVLTLVALSALLTVAVGVVAHNALAQDRATTSTIVVDSAAPALSASEAATAWAQYSRFGLQLVLATDDATNAQATKGLQEQKAIIDASFADYAKANISDAEKAQLAALKATYESAVTIWSSKIQAAASSADSPDAQAAVVKQINAEFVPAAAKVTEGLTALTKGQQTSMHSDLASSKASAVHAEEILWGAAGLGLLLLVGLGFWIAGQVLRPVLAVKAAIEALADGDLTRPVAVDSRDEVGVMAAALARAQETLRESMVTIVNSSATLAGSAEELSAVSAQVAASAEETSVQSGSAAAAAEQVSRNVQTVASATEQMSASIMEISQSSTEAVRVAQAAAEEAQVATGTVAKLGDSSREIGDVVKVITSIAEQTNLLALNATIEAARAGEAGKGFAVVASEVKDLAQETARATEDISRRIEAIQTDSEAAVAAIGRISEIIEEVNSYQSTIAAAVEEQTATTSEMSRSVSEAATGAGGIAGNIEYVATAAQSSSTGIVEAQRAAAELAQLSGDLRELVARFTV